MPDYKNGKVYRIYSLSKPELLYVGATCERLSVRLAKHRQDFRRWKTHKKSYTTSFKIFEECQDYRIELIEAKECKNKEELNQLEGKYIRELNCLNKVIPDRDRKEYYVDNKQEVLQKNKEYYVDNKQVILQKKKEYQQNNKQAILQYNKQYYVDNKQAISQCIKEYQQNNKQAISQRKKKYRENNKQIIAQKDKEYRENNKQAVSQRRKESYEKNKQAILQRKKEYYVDNKQKFNIWNELPIGLVD
jgi:hypothetical protein